MKREGTAGPAATTRDSGGAATPREAILNVARAIETGNKALFLANVYCQDEELSRVAFAVSVCTRELTRDFEREYGKDKWGPFRGRRMPGEAEVAETVRIEEQGDRASAIVPDQDGTTVLVRRGGRWREDLAEEFTPAGIEAVKSNWGRVVRATARARGKIGMGPYKDGPEKILDELVKEISKKEDDLVPGRDRTGDGGEGLPGEMRP